MDVGPLRHRLTLRTNSPSTDAGGGLVDSFSNQITVWGRIEPLRGYEKQVALGIDATLSHKATVRYNSKFTPVNKQITYDSRTFRVHSAVNIDERDHICEMMLTEEV